MTEAFGPTYEAVRDLISRFFDYVKSGILINSIEPRAVLLDSNHYFAPFLNSIVSVVSVDIPSRDVEVAVVSDKVQGKSYVIFYELQGLSHRVVVVSVDDEQASEVKGMIDDLLRWAEEHKEDIARKKVEVLGKIFEALDDEGREKLLSVLKQLGDTNGVN